MSSKSQTQDIFGDGWWAPCEPTRDEVQYHIKRGDLPNQEIMREKLRCMPDTRTYTYT